MKSMKIAAALFTTFAVGTSAIAATTGTLTISGTVATVYSITVAPNSDATNLNITGGETAKLVGKVTEQSNALNGYTINMKSANAGQLVNTNNNTVKTSYKLGYNGQSSVSLNANDTQVKKVNTLSGLTSVDSNVTVDVTALPSAAAGTYSDTITVSIVAN